jgi:curli biogenesis system outer membrane secretion channel CsgG
MSAAAVCSCLLRAGVRRPFLRRAIWLITALTCLAVAQPATMAQPAPAAPAEPAGQPQPAPPPPAAQGAAPAPAEIPVAVLPLGLTAETTQRYPQLAERGVGFGIHDMLVNHLFDRGGFRFVEDKPEVVKDLMDRQWVASTGAVSAESAVRYGRLLGARYTLYGEVYDFSTRRLGRKAAETRISIQIRLIDVETSEFVPASGTGTVTRDGEVFPKGDTVTFARSTVGAATDAALAQAVAQLMDRLVKKGWRK